MKHLFFLIFCCALNLHAWSQASMSITGGNNCTGVTKALTANSGSLAAMGYSWTSVPAGPIFSSPTTGSGTVTFTSTGTYTIAVAILTSNGLEYADSVLTIFANPSIFLSQSSPTTCITINSNPQIPFNLSKPVNIIPYGASTYSVYPSLFGFDQGTGSVTVRPSASTCYTFVGMVSTGCTGSSVACVTVIPQFTIQVSPSPANMCFNDSVALSISNIQNTATGPTTAFTYDWLEATNAPPPSLNFYGTSSVLAYPQNSTTYTVEVSDAISCVSVPALVLVNVNVCTGVKDQLLNKGSWSVFPNPVKDKLTIKPDKPTLVYNVLLIDALGRRVYDENNINTEREIDLWFLKPGIYFIKLESSEGSVVLKVVKD